LSAVGSGDNGPALFHLSVHGEVYTDSTRKVEWKNSLVRLEN
jgi:hypothetical protein